MALFSEAVSHENKKISSAMTGPSFRAMASRKLAWQFSPFLCLYFVLPSLDLGEFSPVDSQASAEVSLGAVTVGLAALFTTFRRTSASQSKHPGRVRIAA